MIKKYILNKITVPIVAFLIFAGAFYLHKKDSVVANVEHNVGVCASVLSRKAFNSLFHGSNFFSRREVAKKYKAIKVDIKNETENILLLDKKGVDLVLTDPLVIQKKLTSTFNIIPFAASGAVSALCTFGLGLAILPTMLASGAVGTAAGFLNFDKSGEKLGQNIRRYSCDLANAFLVPKKETISRIFFVENKNFKPIFNMKFFDLKLEKYFDFKVKIS
jgi:hypothetical protein